MANGNVLSKEIGDDIRRLQNADTTDGCSACGMIRNALVRALRVAEENYKMNRVIITLLFIIVAFVAKIDNTNVIDLVVKIIGGR